MLILLPNGKAITQLSCNPVRHNENSAKNVAIPAVTVDIDLRGQSFTNLIAKLIGMLRKFAMKLSDVDDIACARHDILLPAQPGLSSQRETVLRTLPAPAG
ncbi:hypothetical protein ACVXG7_32135 [Enterobacter hormaechei]